MHSIRRCFFAVLVLLMAAHPAATQDAGRSGAAQSLSARLVGYWLEYGRSENLVNFTADGRISMYLRKGEIGDLHTLDGKWTLSPDGRITMVFALRGREISQSGTISFVGGDMILVDERGVKTSHHRHTGPLPAWTQW